MLCKWLSGSSICSLPCQKPRKYMVLLLLGIYRSTVWRYKMFKGIRILLIKNKKRIACWCSWSDFLDSCSLYQKNDLAESLENQLKVIFTSIKTISKVDFYRNIHPFPYYLFRRKRCEGCTTINPRLSIIEHLRSVEFLIYFNLRSYYTKWMKFNLSNHSYWIWFYISAVSDDLWGVLFVLYDSSFFIFYFFEMVRNIYCGWSCSLNLFPLNTHTAYMWGGTIPPTRTVVDSYS